MSQNFSLSFFSKFALCFLLLVLEGKRRKKDYLTINPSQIVPHFLSLSNNIITRAHHLYLLREESRKKMRFRNSVQPFLSLLIAAFFIGVALAGKTYENYEKAEKIFISEIDSRGSEREKRG